MKNKEVIKSLNIFIIAFALVLLSSSFVSAGVGISWSKETSLIPENTKTCLTYKVYNPWPDDSNVEIRLSEEIMQIVSYIESNSQFIPKETSSKEAIPVEFCFKTPRVYEEDCWLFNDFICKQECLEDMKVYEGEVEVIEVGNQDVSGGTGGSATTISVSAPLRIRVQCVPHSRNYSLVYILIAIIAGILLVINLLKKKKGKKKK